ncbi:MAG: hypothetical protein WBM14_09345 [Terracidiphilus sp.]|jgi:hypothetical protein
MSLLHQESPEEPDDAAKGESFTKGTSHVVWAGIVAAVVVSAIIAIYVIAGEKPPAASGEILEVWAHPMHTETSGFDANGASMPRESFDNVLVFTRVRLHNQSKQPLFLHQILANTTLDDGIHSSYAAMPSDYNRVFIAYPQLAPWRATPFSPETTLEPGQTEEGTFVSSFRLTKQQWDARKGLNFTFGFRYLPSLTLTPRVAVTER